MSSPEASTDWPSRALGPGDLAGALQLSIEAGWNQVDADWRIFLEHGHLMGVDARGRGLVGTAATLPLGPELGWISMMLVGTPFRRRGIGRQLLGQCILDLAAQRLVPGLDATVAGRELYRHYGFRDTWAITRWRRERVPVVPPALPAGVEIRSATAADLAAIAALDSGAFGCDRRSVLASLLARSPRLPEVSRSHCSRTRSRAPPTPRSSICWTATWRWPAGSRRRASYRSGVSCGCSTVATIRSATRGSLSRSPGPS